MSEYTKEDYAALYRKMQATMRDIGGVGKEGYNKFQDYKYQRSEDIVNAVRNALLANDLMFAAGIRAVELAEIVLTETSGTTTKEKLQTRALVHMDMTLLDIVTGATITFPFSNAALDSSDKAVNKAITAAKKFWLLTTFLISTDDDDLDKHDPKPQSQTRQNASKNGATTPDTHKDHSPQPTPPTPANGAKTGKFNWKEAIWWKRAVDALFNEFGIEREHGANLLNKWAKAGDLAQDMTEEQALDAAWKLASRAVQIS